MKTIDIDEAVTVLLTEFVKENKRILKPKYTIRFVGLPDSDSISYLKMNFVQRMRITKKLIDKMKDVYTK